ncbi:MAG TPA: hypothetical protein VNQ76_13810 [Planctomicrobium sp.]|nr:hypothetical protein [Planctomicrobium sp.]
MMQQQTLHERIDNWAQNLSVDGENRIVRNVALAGTTSRNGYHYSEVALQQAVSLYENRPVFLDHAGQRQRPLDRSTRDLVGSVVNAQYIDGRVRGDIRVLDTPSGQTFLKLVECDTPGIGMSHVVLAQRSNDGKAVEKIIEVISVDAVINPATTSTFREVTESPEIRSLEQRLSLVEQERNELLTQNQQQQRELNDLQLREQVQRQLSASGLPTDAISDCFREQLIQVDSEAIRNRLIEDRLRLLTEGRRNQRIVSIERHPSETPNMNNDEFVRILRKKNG